MTTAAVFPTRETDTHPKFAQHTYQSLDTGAVDKHLASTYSSTTNVPQKHKNHVERTISAPLATLFLLNM